MKLPPDIRPRTLASTMLLLAGSFLTTACSKSIKPPIPEPIQPYPATVRVVVDSSKSMGGYFVGATEFKTTLGGIAASLDHLAKQNQGLGTVEYVLLGDHGTLQPQNIGTDEFIRKMRTNSLMQQGDSLLSNAFRNMQDNPSKDEVSLLVSDSIVSYPDAEIRANPTINVDNVASLGSEIETAFTPAARGGTAVYMLAGLSRFDGTYYDYSNAHIHCCSGKRPFYVWVIGPAARAKAIATYLQQQEPTFIHGLAFGSKTLMAKAVVMQSLRRAPGTVYFRGARDPSIIEAKTFPQGKPLQFAVALDLHTLPPMQTTIEFLREHLHLVDDDRALAVAGISTKEEVEGETGNDAGKLLPHYTHVVFVLLKPGFHDGDKGTFTVDSDLPGWYREWSNVDDRKTASEKTPTTFGLQYLVQGVSKAFGESGPVLQAGLTVTK